MKGLSQTGPFPFLIAYFQCFGIFHVFQNLPNFSKSPKLWAPKSSEVLQNLSKSTKLFNLQQQKCRNVGTDEIWANFREKLIFWNAAQGPFRWHSELDECCRLMHEILTVRSIACRLAHCLAHRFNPSLWLSLIAWLIEKLITKLITKLIAKLIA